MNVVPVMMKVRGMRIYTNWFTTFKCKCTAWGSSVASRETVLAAELSCYPNKVHQVWHQFPSES